MEFVKIFGSILIILLIIIAVANQLIKIGCYAETEDMNTITDYSFFGGCRIKDNDGRMIPLDNYRVIKKD